MRSVYKIPIIYFTPANQVLWVYSDPYFRPFVRSSVRPSQSLIRYSCETAEQNFMKLSGIVHYMMPYWTSYSQILLEWFWGFPEQNKNFAIQNMGERWVSFFEHCLQYFLVFNKESLQRTVITTSSTSLTRMVIFLVYIENCDLKCQVLCRSKDNITVADIKKGLVRKFNATSKACWSCDIFFSKKEKW